jgi:hypothetical protein
MEEVGEAGGGIVGVKGDVRGAGAEDGEEGDDEVEGAREAEGDADLGTGAQGEEEACEAEGAEEELLVGEGVLVGADGGGLRGEVGLVDDKVVQAPNRGWPARFRCIFFSSSVHKKFSWFVLSVYTKTLRLL